jgi:hypothetical protein
MPIYLKFLTLLSVKQSLVISSHTIYIIAPLAISNTYLSLIRGTQESINHKSFNVWPMRVKLLYLTNPLPSMIHKITLCKKMISYI